MKKDSKPEKKLHPLSERQLQTFSSPAIASVGRGSNQACQDISNAERLMPTCCG
ncbi:hypothetical protein RBSWK_02981 [Rhodopirellula baltica SWK14]|uniref:Uncharacterized protein n=1 Tax=Rhodopirellula baltica SWK14 TaxID=993516 RepID=L7CH12_RHOBT|nr:hypothetical protein RBSWK_02981 [Rhodopirellula baltica SWK14]